MRKMTTIFARIEGLVRSREVSAAPVASTTDPTRTEVPPGPEATSGREDVRGPGHAPGHRHLGPPPEVPVPPASAVPPPRHAAWHDIGGRIDRLRRNERHG